MEKRLAQATTKTLGKLPKELSDDHVALEVKRLLVHIRTSIKEIGFALGFDERTNFVKYFHRQEGRHPLSFTNCTRHRGIGRRILPYKGGFNLSAGEPVGDLC